MSSEQWEKVASELALVLSPYNLNNWIKPLRFLSFQDNELRIETPGKFFHDWIRDKYYTNILLAARAVFGEQATVNLICGEDQPLTAAAPRAAAPPRGVSLEAMLRERGLNPRYSFANFVAEGSGNEFAYAACRRVASFPGNTSYNPLFIFGGVGLGKTHLLHAIGGEILSSFDGANVTYISSERFTNEMINALRFERMEQFRQRYRSLSALLIDDIQFLAGKERTQEEFFHTFNTLYETGCQIVITGDKYPKDITGLEERLQSRFGWGLVADIKPPDIETKAAILVKKAAQENFNLPDDVALHLAANIHGNVRDLEGALISLEAFCSLTQKAVTIEAANDCLKRLLTQKPSVVTIEAIQKAVAETFQLEISDLKSERRLKHLAEPRQLAMYLCRKLTKASTTAIGEKFGGRDHTTVIFAVGKIEKLLAADTQFQQQVDSLIKNITSP